MFISQRETLNNEPEPEENLYTSFSIQYRGGEGGRGGEERQKGETEGRETGEKEGVERQRERGGYR